MDFLAVILSYPTVVLTVLMVIVLLYWLLVVLGALGIDIGDHADGVGHVHGVDGAGEAAGEGALEAHPIGEGILAFLGVGKVPITVLVSVLALVGWILAILGSYALGALGLAGGWLFTTLVLAGSILLSSIASAYLVRPLAPLFRTDQAVSHRELVGRECMITTGRVDERFGQASLIEGGVDLILQVRCPSPNGLARDSRAILVAYDPEHATFMVEPAA